MSLLTQIVEGGCVPLDAVVAGIPAPLSALTHQLLRAEPSDRLSASRELAQRLTEIEHQ